MPDNLGQLAKQVNLEVVALIEEEKSSEPTVLKQTNKKIPSDRIKTTNSNFQVNGLQ